MPNGRKIIIVAIHLTIPRIERINLVPASRMTRRSEVCQCKVESTEGDILVAGDLRI